MPFLTGIDVLDVQRFIFSSNRLRDIISGSFLVHWSTDFTDGALKGLVSKEQILLNAGGNAIIEFANDDDARTFAARYTRLLYDKACGLTVVIYHEFYEDGFLAEAILALQKVLSQKKAKRYPSVPLQSLSVTATCIETGLLAIDAKNKDNTQDKAKDYINPLSRDVLMRRDNEGLANKHWKEYLRDFPELSFPLELDLLGRSLGDTSMIGVIHIDCNGLGRLIKTWLEKQAQERVSDKQVREKYKECSSQIAQLGVSVLQAVVNHLCKSDGIKEGKVKGVPEKLGFNLVQKDDKWLLPLRPILLGGDDLTFVCDARIALDLVETALDVFDKSETVELGRITACAGVAMVRVHAPFARAYELSEKLCRSAKDKKNKDEDSECFLDWHIGIARPGEALSKIRIKQYRAGDRDLTCRPYRLGSGKDDEKMSWRWLSRSLLDDEECGLRGLHWSERRNKIKNMLGLVHDGPERLESALEAWRVVDEKLHFPALLDKSGFINNDRTPLLDAVELLDLHLMLLGNKGNQSAPQEEII